MAPKTREYPEDKIEEMLELMRDRFNITGEIPKNNVAGFINNLFEQNEIDWLDSPIPDYYFRKSKYRGFHIITENNKRNDNSIVEVEGANLKLESIEESVTRLYTKPKQLIKTLLPYEKELKSLITKNQKLEKKLYEINSELLKQKQEKDKWQKKFKESISTINKLFYYSNSQKNNLYNLFNISTSERNRDKRVTRALESLFSDNADLFIDEPVCKQIDESEKDITEQKSTSNLLDFFKSL